MDGKSYFWGAGMEDFLNFIRNMTPCSILLMFAIIAMVQDFSGVNALMAWVLMAIACYGTISSVCVFTRKMHQNYRNYPVKFDGDNRLEIIKNTMLSLVEILGLMLYLLSISFFVTLCIMLATKGANGYIPDIVMMK
ncbi:hypothetical protein [Aeromonas allosaccharophila]|uniref:hypothetical protein n=1 Tax=Aeromonas allosaccharophila TaxID=656 RepID=UPI002AE0813A|nr:hypothetical protein [Aeromonas allosaccharophila]